MTIAKHAGQTLKMSLEGPELAKWISVHFLRQAWITNDKILDTARENRLTKQPRDPRARLRAHGGDSYQSKLHFRGLAPVLGAGHFLFKFVFKSVPELIYRAWIRSKLHLGGLASRVYVTVLFICLLSGFDGSSLFFAQSHFPMKTNAFSLFLRPDPVYQILAFRSCLPDPGHKSLATRS